MNSYLVHTIASMRLFSRLSIEGVKRNVLVWNFYKQLNLRPNQSHYRRVKDYLFGSFMCQFDKKLHNSRVSEVSWMKVNEYGCLFLQFPTFTYLVVGCFEGVPYVLPRYPTDKIILMELVRKIITMHSRQLEAHKTGFKFPLIIESYSLTTYIKAKSMKTKLQEITLKKFKGRKDFD